MLTTADACSVPSGWSGVQTTLSAAPKVAGLVGFVVTDGAFGAQIVEEIRDRVLHL